MTSPTNTWKAFRAALMALLLAQGGAGAADNAGLRPGNGIEKLDLLGDGTPAMTVIGRRENFNAHSFDVVSFFIRLGDRWEIVPLIEAGQEQDSLTSSGGADCLLHDFRLIRSRSHRPLTLVLADRDYGESFVDVRPVSFRVYRLARNEQGMPGAPTWSFQLHATRPSSGSYCDVGEAFARETVWKE